MEWHQFALVLTVPSDREEEWLVLLDSAVAPSGVLCSKQHACLVLMEVEAEMEFLAIERAEQWLHSIAEQGNPPFRIGTNAQPMTTIHV